MYARGDGGNGVGAGDGNVHVKQSKEAKKQRMNRANGKENERESGGEEHSFAFLL